MHWLQRVEVRCIGVLYFRLRPQSGSPVAVPSDSQEGIRFGEFELDLRTAELRTAGEKLYLQEQPFRILAMLLERPGQLVTRDELKKALWASDTFVDFDHSLNRAMNRLREVLEDSAENPRFIETLPRRGYRFIAPVQPLNDGSAEPARSGVDPAFEITPHKPLHWKLAAGLFGVVLAAALATSLVWRLGRRGSAETEIRSIAVLPLENLSGDPSQEYFVDGMTDELITELAQISSLKVISRTSVMRYKGTQKSSRQIAGELGVDGLIEGSMLREGDRVRITVQLVHAPTDRHLWAKSYERDLRDVLALESDVAQAIAREIHIKVMPEEQTLLANMRPVNPQAHELYLKGRYEWDKRTSEGLRKALEYFQRAIDLDPSYALAYAGLADCYDVLGNNGFLPYKETFPKAKAAAVQALASDGSLAEAHTSLALALQEYDWDWASAEREFRRAIELNPGYAGAHHWYALFLLTQGQPSRAIAEIERARELDPLSIRINVNVGPVLIVARQYDRAIVELQKALELEPDDVGVHMELGTAYLQKGIYPEALAEIQKGVSLAHSSIPSAYLAYAYALAGQRMQALRILTDLKERAGRIYVRPSGIAVIYIGLGEKEKALAILEKEYLERNLPVAKLAAHPMYDPLRSDPRFQDLLRRIGVRP